MLLKKNQVVQSAAARIPVKILSPSVPANIALMKNISVVSPKKNINLLTAQSNYMLVSIYKSSYAFYLKPEKYDYLVTTANMSHKDVDCYQ